MILQTGRPKLWSSPVSSRLCSLLKSKREKFKIRLEKFFTPNSGDLTETAVDLLRSIHGSYSASTSSLNALWYRSGFAVPPSSSPASVSFESYLNAIRNVVNVEFQSESESRSEKRHGERGGDQVVVGDVVSLSSHSGSLTSSDVHGPLSSRNPA